MRASHMVHLLAQQLSVRFAEQWPIALYFRHVQKALEAVRIVTGVQLSDLVKRCRNRVPVLVVNTV